MSNHKFKKYVEHGVTFIPVKNPENEKHSWHDLGLVPTSRPVFAPPQYKSKEIEIPGADGVLDLTESLTGDVKYSNRVGSLEFRVDNRNRWTIAYSEIMNFLQGQIVKAILDDDPGYYYLGRFSVNEWRSEQYRSIIVIDYNVHPYKYDLFSSLEDWLWDPFDFETGVIREYEDIFVEYRKEFTVIGSKMPVTPTFIVETFGADRMTVEYNGVDYVLNNGSSQILDIVIRDGETRLVFKGYGFVSIDYRGGSL